MRITTEESLIWPAAQPLDFAQEAPQTLALTPMMPPTMAKDVPTMNFKEAPPNGMTKISSAFLNPTNGMSIQSTANGQDTKDVQLG